MTTSPRKNLPRTSLFFSVQILSPGAVDKTYNSMCELKQSNPLPNETKSHGLFFAQICVSQVTNFYNSTIRVEFCISSISANHDSMCLAVKKMVV
jgi:hypothetical protein